MEAEEFKGKLEGSLLTINFSQRGKYERFEKGFCRGVFLRESFGGFDQITVDLNYSGKIELDSVLPQVSKILQIDGDEVNFDGRTIGSILGKDARYKRSVLFMKDRAFSKCIDDIVRVKHWFENYQSKEALLRLLSAGDLNIGTIENSGVAKRVFRWLNEMDAHANH